MKYSISILALLGLISVEQVKSLKLSSMVEGFSMDSLGDSISFSPASMGLVQVESEVNVSESSSDSSSDSSDDEVVHLMMFDESDNMNLD